MTRVGLPGRPLTGFGRGRPNLPLPQERVKRGGRGGRCSTSAGLLDRGSHPHPSPLPQGGLCVTLERVPRSPSPQPSPREDLCVTRAWLPGRPLTEFGRGRPILPLPQERVKSRAAFEVGAGSCKGLLKGEGERAAPSSRTGRRFARFFQGTRERERGSLKEIDSVARCSSPGGRKCFCDFEGQGSCAEVSSRRGKRTRPQDAGGMHGLWQVDRRVGWGWLGLR